MSRWRLVAGVGVVAVLALTLIVLSVQGGSPSPSTTTTLVVSPPTTTSTSAVSTTAAEPTTLTTSAEQRLVEVEELLGDLWFGWFDAIYRKDPDALWQVVATTTFHDDGSSSDGHDGIYRRYPIGAMSSSRNVAILFDQARLPGRRKLRGHDRIPWTYAVTQPSRSFGQTCATAFASLRVGSSPMTFGCNDCDNLIREVTP